MSTKTEYENLAKTCQELLDLGPVDREAGICHSLVMRNLGTPRYSKCRQLFDEIVERWPHFSGNWVYPVPGDGTPYQNPQDCFNRTPDLWEGRQGELRRDLLEFVIATCSKRILSLSFPQRDIGPFRALLVE